MKTFLVLAAAAPVAPPAAADITKSHAVPPFERIHAAAHAASSGPIWTAGKPQRVNEHASSGGSVRLDN